jgi:gamma-glutamyl:cysteine ligase YbdK (ATP-grasp superfamily)
MPTFGLEEEVFVVEPERPSLKSLYYLSRLLWRDPRRHYRLTASNFSRGPDMRQALMSGVEVATEVHTDTDSIMEDLATRRSELAGVSEGLIAPIGHLITLSTPTNVCALQIHVGGVNDLEAVYGNIARFLPVLTLITADSPFAGGEYFGQSFRMAHGYAIGALKEDRRDRFQDLIITKRLGTIEVRVPDPVWDLNRVKTLMGAIEAIAGIGRALPFERNDYNSLRAGVAKRGFTEELEPLYSQLGDFADIPREMLENTASDEIKESYAKNGLAATYSALDNGYRNGRFEAGEIPANKAAVLKSMAGMAGYYVPKLPYVLWKYLKEK